MLDPGIQLRSVGLALLSTKLSRWPNWIFIQSFKNLKNLFVFI